ncbi:MAG: endonuclease III [Candidatus Pacearchaeota archaeon]
MNRRRALKQLKKLEKLSGKMRLAAEGWSSKFQTLIATILSARSLDETTIKYATLLFKKYPDAKKLSKARVKDVMKIIKPVNFYRNKSMNIINCSKKLVEEHDGIIPMNFDKLIELPGVGRKTANVFLSEYGHNTIGIDTHLSYISRYLKWTKNSRPEKIEEDLKILFPKNHWSKLNPVSVKFGKKHTSRKEKNFLLDKIKSIK